MSPTLSQIRSYSTQHLTDAARYWQAKADIWRRVFTDIHQQTSAANAAKDFAGQAGEAWVGRSDANRLHAMEMAEHLQNAAALAQRDAVELDHLKQQVLDTVQQAQGNQFTVEDDLSVVDTKSGETKEEQISRQMQAQTYADQLQYQANSLFVRDAQTAMDFTSISTELSVAPLDPGDAIPPPPVPPTVSTPQNLLAAPPTGASQPPYMIAAPPGDLQPAPSPDGYVAKNPQLGSLLAAAGGGCAGGAGIAMLLAAPFPPAELVMPELGCETGAAGAAGWYVGGIWLDNMFHGGMG